MRLGGFGLYKSAYNADPARIRTQGREGQRIKHWVWDLLGLAGVASIGAGCWLVYPPSAFIVVGLALCLLGVNGARNHGSSDRRVQ